MEYWILMLISLALIAIGGLLLLLSARGINYVPDDARAKPLSDRHAVGE